MAQTNRVQVLFPVGRLVQGSLYKARDKDATGNPLVHKSGPDAGKPRVDYFFAIAIAKGPEAAHGPKGWQATEWGGKLYQVGSQGFPQGQFQGNSFAWKVTDGDSTEFNQATKPRRWCDHEGFPGHWIVRFSSSFAPKVYDSKGKTELSQPDLVKPGYYVQVFGTVASNGNLQKPGLYVNHSMVAFSFAGEEISSGPDASTVGFGEGTVRPAGAIDAPAVAASPFAGQQPAAAPAMLGAAAAPAMPAMQPAAPGAMPAMPGAAAAAPAMPAAAPAQIVVQPHAGFMQAPAAGAAPVAPGAPAAPAPAVKSLDDRRTASGMAYTVAQWIASGWTEATLVQHGHLLPY